MTSWEISGHKSAMKEHCISLRILLQFWVNITLCSERLRKTFDCWSSIFWVESTKTLGSTSNRRRKENGVREWYSLGAVNLGSNSYFDLKTSSFSLLCNCPCICFLLCLHSRSKKVNIWIDVTAENVQYTGAPDAEAGRFPPCFPPTRNDLHWHCCAMNDIFEKLNK